MGLYGELCERDLVNFYPSDLLIWEAMNDSRATHSGHYYKCIAGDGKSGIFVGVKTVFYTGTS